jgi:hypothetical protein
MTRSYTDLIFVKPSLDIASLVCKNRVKGVNVQRLSDIFGSHGVVCEDGSLLGYSAV